MKAITKEWLKAANDDLLLIEKIISDEHLTHLAAFHAQQSIEKSFKAVIEEHELELEKIHNLQRLYKSIEKQIDLNIDMQLIKMLDKLYISSRYPGDLGLLPEGKPTLEDVKEFFDFAKDIYIQIKQVFET